MTIIAFLDKEKRIAQEINITMAKFLKAGKVGTYI